MISELLQRLEQRIEALLDDNQELAAKVRHLEKENATLVEERHRVGSELDRILAKLDQLG